MAEGTEKVADTPLNFTAVAPAKFVPVIVTTVPAGPLAGAKLAIVGAPMKLDELVAVPPAVVTLNGPVVTPAGAVAWIEVAEATEKPAATPLNFTALAPVKFVPVIVTTVPAAPLVGVKLAIVGGTTKLAELVAVPPAVVTLSGPVVTPAGAVAWIEVVEATEKPAATPLNFTAVAPAKFVPVIVTTVPAPPFVGVKLAIVGGTTKFDELVAVPPGVVTLNGPVVTPAGAVV